MTNPSRRPAIRRYTEGFTLLELMTVILVVAVGVVLALPSFREITLRSTTTAIGNDLVGAFAQARAEAVKRGVFVAVVAKSGGSEWSSGWDVKADAKRDGTYTETVLSHEAVPLRYAVRATRAAAPADRVVFSSQGDLVGGDELHLNVCRADRNAALSRFIRVRSSGEVTSQRDIAPSSAPAC